MYLSINFKNVLFLILKSTPSLQKRKKKRKKKKKKRDDQRTITTNLFVENCHLWFLQTQYRWLSDLLETTMLLDKCLLQEHWNNKLTDS